MIDYSDGHCVVLHSRQQRARLQHKCTECRREIGAGETYLVERTVFDGDAMTHKICAHCQQVRAYLQEHCGGWLYRGLHEDIADHYYSTESNDASERKPRLLALGMHTKWRRASGALWPIPKH